MHSLETWQKLLENAPVIDGVALMDLIDYPEPLRSFLQKLIRKRRVTAVTLAELIDLSMADITILLPLLIEKGYIQTIPATKTRAQQYRTNLTWI